MDKKQVAEFVKAAKESRGRLTWPQVYAACSDPIVDAAEVELRKWSRECKAKYDKIAVDLMAIERSDDVYLTDSAIDEDNVLVDGRSADSVDFWEAMLRAIGPAAGDRAEAAGIDLNARLGYAVY